MYMNSFVLLVFGLAHSFECIIQENTTEVSLIVLYTSYHMYLLILKLIQWPKLMLCFNSLFDIRL